MSLLKDRTLFSLIINNLFELHGLSHVGVEMGGLGVLFYESSVGGDFCWFEESGLPFGGGDGCG